MLFCQLQPASFLGPAFGIMPSHYLPLKTLKSGLTLYHSSYDGTDPDYNSSLLSQQDHPGRNFTEKVREAQMEIELLNLKSVDAMGLKLEPDVIHLTTESQVELGEKLANAILQSAPLSVQSSGASRYSHNSIFRSFF
ncbi:hypothetical protein Leryth_015227 [Lithospermum erythrorhizon]|nr:hypothetical protein Leryth_015227 [Lithospermum erythrorhizon]